MHSHSARHKTLPQKQKCIWGRRIWRKKLQKEKIHAKIQAEEKFILEGRLRAYKEMMEEYRERLEAKENPAGAGKEEI